MSIKNDKLLIGIVSGSVFLLFVTLSWLVEGKHEPTGPAGIAAGRTAPSRIVSLAPSVTEILFALGLDQEIIGVTDHCNYPAAALTRPRVGGFKGKSLEAIVGLEPDLVIGTGDGNEQGIFQTLDRLGIPFLSVQPSTLTEVISSIRAIGRATGREAEALALARSMEAGLEEVSARVEGTRSIRVLFVYGRDPLVLAGPGTFAHDMIQRAGGENVACDSAVPYPRFSMETVIRRAPEVIVEGVMGSELSAEGQKQAMAFWSRWESLPAVRSGRVVLIHDDLVARPGPRIVEGLWQLARALHPERFAGEELK